MDMVRFEWERGLNASAPREQRRLQSDYGRSTRVRRAVSRTARGCHEWRRGRHERAGAEVRGCAQYLVTEYLYAVAVPSTCTLEPVHRGRRGGTHGFPAVPVHMYSVLVPRTANSAAPGLRGREGVARGRGTGYRYRVHRYEYGRESAGTRGRA